jgi:hypothetical protein
VSDDVLMQKLASIHRCVQQVRTFVGGDLDRLKDALVQDVVVDRHLVDFEAVCRELAEA